MPVSLIFQPGSQIQVVSIDRICHDPINGNLCVVQALHHSPRQLTLGLKTDGFRNPNLFAARAVFHPMTREVEFTVQQRVAKTG